MEFPGDVFPIFQKKLVIMCILRQKKLQLPQRDSPGLEVETAMNDMLDNFQIEQPPTKGFSRLGG